MKYKNFETESGIVTNKAEFDGVILNDIFEHLMFQVEIVEGSISVFVKEANKEHFDNFNTSKWLKIAKELVENNEVSLIDTISGTSCKLVEESIEVEPEIKENIGEFTTKRKFINFVTGLKSRIRILNNYAYIDGKQLSGMLEGSKFKITICDGNTINFEEVDTKLSDKDMIIRIIDDIDSMDVTGYVQKFIIPVLKFYTENLETCYLEVDHTKPIDKLYSFFDNIEMKTPEISERTSSILDALFSSENEVELEKESEVEKIIETESQKLMRESFEKMNIEKINELKDRIGNVEKDIQKSKIEVKNNETKQSNLIGELKILNTRLDSFNKIDDDNGYSFFIADEDTNDIVFDETLSKLVHKISPILKLNPQALIKYLTKGFFSIKIINKIDDDYVSKNIINKVMGIDITGDIKIVTSPIEKDLLAKDGYLITDSDKARVISFEYRGELNWHQLVDRMIRLGFTQNPDFNKECGSNSYETKYDGNKNLDITTTNKI